MKEKQVLEVMIEFLDESRENLRRAEGDLIRLEEDPGNEELVNSVFRVFHSIKGSSGFLGLAAVAQLTHKLENILSAIKEKRKGVDKELINLVLKGIDTLNKAICRVEKDPEAAALTEEEEKFKEELEEFFRSFDEGDLLSQGENLVDKFMQLIKNMKEADIDISRHPLMRSIAGNMDSILKEISVKKKPRRVSFDCVSQGRDFNPQARTIFECIDLLRERKISDSLLLKTQSALEALSEIFQMENRNIYEKAMLSFRNIQMGWTMVEDRLYQEFFDDFYADFLAAMKAVFPQRQAVEKERRALETALPEERRPAPEDDKKGLHHEEKFIRIRQEKLDQFMNQLGELIITKDVFNSVYHKFQAGNREREAAEELMAAIHQMDEISGNMQDSLMEIRKVPLRQIFQKFPRLVREVSGVAGKQVRLDIKGEDALLDKNLVELIEDPLVHILRNSIDHGIEASAGERIKAGKPEEGRISILASADKEWARIIIEDDGRGIDTGKIKRAAVERGVLSETEAEAMPDAEIRKLIFRPGFSTAEKVTDISGRGVGMDVVMHNLKKCDGRLDLESTLGAGTRLTLKLPQALTLVTKDAVVVRVGGELFTFPTENVESVIDLKEEEIRYKSMDGLYNFNGQVVKLERLSVLLNNHAPHSTLKNNLEKKLTALVINRSSGEKTALVVDDIENFQKIVVRPFVGNYLKTLNKLGFSGFTILGDGRVVLILDIEGLLN